ncbi:MAG: FAD binding domain-containing protein, partial [Syntrophales bacterium]
MPSFTYVRPKSLVETFSHLAADNARIHAGGTDLLGCLHDGVFAAEKVVSISRL